MRLPQLSLPWAILASVIFAGIVVLLALHIVTWPTLAAFLGGVVIPAMRERDSDRPSPPPLPVLFFGTLFVCVFGFVALACSQPKIAKTEYGAQVQACVEVSHTRDEFDACFHAVQIKWDEAGAPPALVFPKDGGDQ